MFSTASVSGFEFIFSWKFHFVCMSLPQLTTRTMPEKSVVIALKRIVLKLKTFSEP